jgi:ferredoxin
VRRKRPCGGEVPRWSPGGAALASLPDRAATHVRNDRGRCAPAPAPQEVRPLNVSIDRDACIGCGACEEDCPDVFKLDDDDVSAVIVADTAGYEDCIIAAAEGCPAEAIIVDQG